MAQMDATHRHKQYKSTFEKGLDRKGGKGVWCKFQGEPTNLFSDVCWYSFTFKPVPNDSTRAPITPCYT